MVSEFGMMAYNPVLGISPPTIDWSSSNLTENLRKFKRTAQIIFNGPLVSKSEEVKVNYLLLWVGEAGRDIVDTWGLSADEAKILNTYWTKFEAYVKPKSNFRVARFKLRALTQKDGETIDSFYTRIKLVAEECEYMDKEDQILDTIIAGINNENVRRKLVAKNNDFKLHDALKLVREYESTSKQMSEIKDTTTSAASGIALNTITRPKTKKPKHSSKPKQVTEKRRETYNKQCSRCGEKHPYGLDNCPAKKMECYNCGKTGHKSKLCFFKQPKKHRVNEVSEDQSMSFHLDSVDKDEENSLKHTQVFAAIVMNNKRIKCKLDTGAQTNVMPVRVFHEIFPKRRVDSLKKPQHKLYAYGGKPIENLGTIKIDCTHDQIQKKLLFNVTSENGTTMLGLKTCLDLELITLNDIIKRNNELGFDVQEVHSRKKNDFHRIC